MNLGQAFDYRTCRQRIIWRPPRSLVLPVKDGPIIDVITHLKEYGHDPARSEDETHGPGSRTRR